jgi:hypothetical protein
MRNVPPGIQTLSGGDGSGALHSDIVVITDETQRHDLDDAFTR